MRKTIRRLWARLRKPHPISSLPPEIISTIFIHCLPTLGAAPSRMNAPLLVAQICRSWRAIALQTPELWVDISLVCKGRRAVDILELWTSRAGSLPLNYLLISGDAEEGRLLVGAAMRHHERWGSLCLGVPWVSYVSAKIHTLADASFPVLHTLQLHICPSDALLDRSSNKLIIRDAPNLRAVTISASSHFFAFPICLLDIPWGRLKSLDVQLENHKWAESVSTLLLCTNLAVLTVTSDVEAVPIPAQITGHITMPFLQSLDLDNPYLVELLDHVTLPYLRKLRLSSFGDSDDFDQIQSFFLRAACPIQHLTLTVGDPQFLRRIVGFAPLVVHLALHIISAAPDILGLVGTALQPGVLPALQELSV
ncbi:hypothetical protein K438DRAFT_2025734 [Mycena galopus ATCC 62051]|nr:hypothetical protein K438DRAFT_2025734 [Mycena galopus ATCC 62051]